MRPRGTPPMPSARSSESAPVEIASIGIALWSPRRISEPAPNWRSIWVTAASRAASLALASLAPASISAFLGSAISSITSSAAVRGQLKLCQRGVLRTLRPDFRTVESDPDATEEAQQALRQRLRGPLHLAVAPAALLLAHPRNRDVGPERPLLRLIQPRRDQPLREFGLQLDRVGRGDLERVERRCPAPANGHRLGRERHLRLRSAHFVD